MCPIDRARTDIYIRVGQQDFQIRTIQSYREALLRRHQECEALSNCDTSSLLPDLYRLEDRISIGDDFEVWEARSVEGHRDVAIMLFYPSERVYSGEIAEKMLDLQAQKRRPLARGGSGYASYLVYTMRAGRKLGRSVPAIQKIMFGALVAFILASVITVALWPSAFAGVTAQIQVFEDHGIVHDLASSGSHALKVDYEGRTVVWTNTNQEIWRHDDDAGDQLLGSIPGYALALDLCPGGEHLLLLDDRGGIDLFDQQGHSRRIDLPTARDAWFSSSGERIYALSRDMQRMHLYDVASSISTVLPIDANEVLVATSDPDVYAAISEAKATVFGPQRTRVVPVPEYACSFDIDQGRVAFGTKRGVVHVKGAGDPVEIKLPERSPILRVLLCEDTVYFATLLGLYTASLEHPEQIISLKVDPSTYNTAQKLSWDDREQRLLIATKSGIHQWGDVHSH